MFFCLLLFRLNTMKTLELNFAHNDQSKIDQCMQELQPLGQFTFQITGPDPRNCLTKPEYAYIKKSVVLTFESLDLCREFMGKPDAQTIYQKYAA